MTSKDGTPITYDRQGRGPAIILVGGAFVDRSENAPLATDLAERFTVYNYDRRGRGHSGDTQPYAVDREIEDLQALIAEGGGSAYLYGVSSGGALVLEAAAAGVAVDKLAVYEVPYNMADDGPQRQREYVETLERLLAEGRRGDAAELFMRVAGASEEIIAEARSSPVWPGLEALAHTLAYDAACVGNGQPPTDRLTRITRPTLVLTGGASAESFVGGGGDFFDRAADAIAASVPRARRETLAGQTHIVDPKALAPVLGEVLPGMTSHSSLIPELNAALQRLACARPYVVSEGTLACRETASGRGYTGCMHDTRLRLPAGAGREHLSPRQANGVIHEAAAYRVVG